MKKLSNNVIWSIVILIVLTLSFSFLIGPENNPEVLGIDKLVQKINAGEVEKIVVQGDELKIALKNGATATSKKEQEAGLTETLKNYGVKESALQTLSFEIQDPSGFKFWMSVLLPTLLPVIVIVIIFWFVFRGAKNGASQAFSFGRSNIKLFTAFKNKITFKDVAGLKEAKKELEEVVDFLKSPKKYLDIGAKIPRGVLLMGAPGTGKTLLARAVAGEAGVPFFHLSASEFVEMFVGVGASRTRDAFLTAKKAAPSILFIDEIDAVGRERGAGLGGGHDEREQTLNQILVEMDGFEQDTKVIVLAATNRPDILDRALLRPGRFDRRVVLDLPDMIDREAILKLHARGKKMEKDIDLKKIAIRTPGFSGADLANLMNEAAILAAGKNRLTVAQDDLYNSIEKVLLGPERKNRIISEQEKKITAYHEAGHALVGASLKDADPVHKVSIISRGFAGGYTLNLPSEDRRLHARAHFFADLAVMMGGYSSENEVFGDMTTGASDDLKKASELARKIVTKFGMSEKIGPITYGETEEMVFLGKEMTTGKNYSEKTSSEIDAEVRSILDRAHAVAKNIVRIRRKALDAIAEALIEKESLEQEEFYKIVSKFKFRPIAA